MKNITNFVFLFTICFVQISCEAKSNDFEFYGTGEKPPVDYKTPEIDPYKVDPNPAPKEIDGYQLVFQDEFNHEGPMKTEFWNAEKGFCRNEEDQWYTADNGYCTNGRLVITAEKEQVENPNYEAGSTNWKKNRKLAQYTSASFITKSDFREKYDHIMMIARAKLPLQSGGDEDYGVWPAFWTTGGGSWPHGGEIDIMEYYNGRMMANFAWKGANGTKWDGNKQQNSSTSYVKNYIDGTAKGFDADPNWLKKYHTWKLVGDGTWLTIYLDDVFMAKIAIDTKNVDTSKREYPFKNNTCNFWLNLAVGGNPHPDKDKLNNTTFPRQYEIDYARIYVKKID